MLTNDNRRSCEKHPEILIDGNGICWKCMGGEEIKISDSKKYSYIWDIQNIKTDGKQETKSKNK
jgi:hypothetical protein